jgi:hypothetical protein
MLQDFLDSKLPKTAEKVRKAVDKVKLQIAEARGHVEQLGRDRMAKGANEMVPQETKARQKLEELQQYHERLLTQERFLRAGTRVVSRLEATGRARQLMTDEEHALSALLQLCLSSCGHMPDSGIFTCMRCKHAHPSSMQS